MIMWLVVKKRIFHCSPSFKSQSRLLLSPEGCWDSFYPGDKNQCEVLKAGR